MENDILEKIIVQFMDIVSDLSKQYNVTIISNTLKLVSRKHFDELVIDVFYQTKIKDITDVFLPTPLVTIEYTHVEEDD